MSLPCWWLLAAVLTGASSQQCFSDAILPAQRKHIMFDGEVMPLGLWENRWASCLITSRIWQILTEEKLGYNVTVDGAASSRTIIYALAGCDLSVANGNGGSCGNTRYMHFSFESWEGYHDYVEDAFKSFGDKVPRNLGNLGYLGYEGMYVMDRSLQTALNQSGVGLDFYRFYNVDFFTPALYTAKVSDVNLDRLQTCADSIMVSAPESAALYLAATGDNDGVKTESNKTVLNCWQDKWWVAPACRQNPGGCIPCITAQEGWGLTIMIQQAAFHNMPIAFASATGATAEEGQLPLGRELQSLVYWWFPDTMFTLDNPSPVIFPAYSQSEQSQSIYRTMKENSLLTKWAAGGIETVADKPVYVATQMNLFTDDMRKLLLRYVQLGGDHWQTACEWLLENPTVWESWLPNETACTSGRGLIDANGQYITDRGQAVGCEVCPVGHHSVEQGQTRVCLPCGPGDFQGLPGEDSCLPCEKGKVAAETGSMSCTLCPLGEFANDTGMSACHICGAGTGQEEKWTTSQAVLAQGKEQWLQVQGADSESYCGCIAGTYLWNGRCEDCIQGSFCEGSSRLLLQPGFFSRAEEPGAVYRCFDEPVRCPGGEPGTCAFGRDTSTIACSACLPGLHVADGECVECVGGDYVLLISVGILSCVGIGILYVVLVNEGQKSRQPGSLLIAALGMGQMVTTVQQLTVIQQFKIEWGQPFAGLLLSLEVFSFDLDMISIGCVAPMSPVAKFSSRTLTVVGLLLVASLFHFLYLLVTKAKSFQLSLLLRTSGTLFVVFFISLCSSLLAPFRCSQHPNGRWTVQAYHGVYCNGQGDHQVMVIVGGLACLMPVGFLAICMWVIIIELPKRLQAADVKFLRACSFLFMRFRPGAEIYSVVFLIRNALVVLCPLLSSPSGKVVCMNLILYGSLAMVAYSKPWRAPACNFLDVMLLTCMLVILDAGSLFIREDDGATTMAICMIFSGVMVLSIVVAVSYGVGRHFMLKYRKQFRFFLCHQKVAAGSMARLLKMELQKRSSRNTTFVDCDDLNDLTRLFSYVGLDTEHFVILGSPDILTRKWCVGEMCTARSHKVHTVLLKWPEFVNPDQNFIKKYDEIVPDISELANYNIGLQEVQETMAWINTVQRVDVPSLVSLEGMEHICSSLTGSMRSASQRGSASPNCVILSDLDNMEAAATAYVLLGLIVPKLVGAERNNMPAVLEKGRPVPQTSTAALVICSDGCFKQPEFGDWLLNVAQLSNCCVLPIIAEDGFRFPSPSYYEEIESLPQLEMLDMRIYVPAIKAVFQEIAVVFSPQNYSSTQEDLDLRAKQVAWRINSGSLKSLYQKIAGEVEEEREPPEEEKSTLSTERKAGEEISGQEDNTVQEALSDADSDDAFMGEIKVGYL